MAASMSDTTEGSSDDHQGLRKTDKFRVGDRAEVVFYDHEGKETVYQGVVEESHTTQVVRINHEWFLADEQGNFTRLPSLHNKGLPAIARPSSELEAVSESDLVIQGARQRRSVPRAAPILDDESQQCRPTIDTRRRSYARGSR